MFSGPDIVCLLITLPWIINKVIECNQRVEGRCWGFATAYPYVKLPQCMVDSGVTSELHDEDTEVG